MVRARVIQASLAGSQHEQRRISAIHYTDVPNFLAGLKFYRDSRGLVAHHLFLTMPTFQGLIGMPVIRRRLIKLLASFTAAGVMLTFLLVGFHKPAYPVDLLGKTLIVHIFADTDPEYIENLKFFVHYGISVGDIAAEYVIIVQSDATDPVRPIVLLLLFNCCMGINAA